MCPCEDSTVVTTTPCAPCTDCNPPCADTIQSECIVYSGPTLDNIGIDTNQGLNDVILAIDGLIDQSIENIQVTIPALNVLTLNSAPYIIIPSPGTDNYIEIIKVSCFMNNLLTTPYTLSSVTSLGIKSTTATNPELVCNNSALAYTTSSIISNFRFNTTSVDTIRVNDDIIIYDLGGDPTLGTGDLVLNIIYKIQSIN